MSKVSKIKDFIVFNTEKNAKKFFDSEEEALDYVNEQCPDLPADEVPSYRVFELTETVLGVGTVEETIEVTKIVPVSMLTTTPVSETIETETAPPAAAV